MTTVIAHLKPSYLELTETFIYTYLKHACRFQPLVITDIASNLSDYPIACSYLLKRSEVDHYHKILGKSSDYFLRNFFHQLNYPNCFENLIRERNIPLLHAHFGLTGYRALELKNRLGIPLITAFYGIDASQQIKDPRTKKALAELFEKGDRFLVLGNDMAQRLQKAGCPFDKITIQPIAVDLNQIPFHLRQFPEFKERLILLYCGRLVEKKGILHAIEAFAQLAKTWHNLEFRIVGGGQLWQAVNRAVRDKNLQPRVKLLGAKSHASALKEMQQAHIFILPSQTAGNGDMEGTPTVLLEAQASGMPFVSTFHADIPEIAHNGETGILVPEGDASALAEGIKHLLTHPELWAQMGTAGRQYVETHHNIKIEIHKMESIYTEMLR